ncbi:Uncharacterised protein [Mycobacteroides abscessus subsp. massiliense]|nr:Uncharacterised protein [Mycobacteroides abscessus subsp. massiliense]
MPVPQGIIEALQRDHRAALASHESVCVRVEGCAPAVGGQHRPLRKQHPNLWSEHQHCRSGERKVNLASPQTLTGQVHGEQTRGACRVDSH